MALTFGSDATGNLQRLLDAASTETIAQYKPAILVDDFVGPGSVVPAAGSAAHGYPWVSKIVDTEGTPTVAVTSNGAGGIMACALDSTSEAQEATLYAGDVLNWDVDDNLIYEARIAASVLPTGNAGMAFGVSSAWVADGAETHYLRFSVASTGIVSVQGKDGTTTTNTATSVTLSAAAFHIFRIDATNPAAVVFQIDGATVGTAPYAATGGSAVLQPLAGVWKASGTGVATLQIDRIMVAMDRS
jgi:hypothetical protein